MHVYDAVRVTADEVHSAGCLTSPPEHASYTKSWDTFSRHQHHHIAVNIPTVHSTQAISVSKRRVGSMPTQLASLACS